MRSVKNLHGPDSSEIDPFRYLEDLNESLTPSARLEHYTVLKPILLRLQVEDLAAFDLAVKEINKKLGIKAKTVKDDLSRLAEPPAAKEALKLLEQMGQTHFLRFAQDYIDGKLWFGVKTGEDKLLVNSSRELLTLDQVPEELIVKDGGFDISRFSRDGILRFMHEGTETGHALLADVRSFFTRFAIFRDTRTPLLLAAWTLGTYCYRVFRVFSYLVLRSPDKRCGKSRVLDLLSLLAFNASSRVVYPTEAQIFREPSRNGGTLLLDEVEALKNADKDNYAGLLAVLNNGFEQGGNVQREEKNMLGNFQGKKYETYCPRALAGINRLADTLEDRSIMIVMQRKLAREKTERFSPARLEDEAQALRDRIYIWALTHAADLAAVYDQADTSFSALDSLDDRARDLWEPHVSIVALADVERDDNRKTLTDELTALALDLSQVREGAAEDSTTVQVVNALQAIVLQKQQDGLFQKDQVGTFTPTDLASLLKGKLNWEKLSTKTLASLLYPLGLCSLQTRHEGKVSRAYHLSENDLSELDARYTTGEIKKEEKK
jgi:Protein of unknown function (DUF3631)